MPSSRTPKFRDRVAITTPSKPAVDPATGKETTPVPHQASDVPARLSQRPVAEVSGQSEQRAEQNTTISSWTILVPPGTVLTDLSTVLDQRGRTFEVDGEVADRPNDKPQFRAAALRLISDIQE